MDRDEIGAWLVAHDVPPADVEPMIATACAQGDSGAGFAYGVFITWDGRMFNAYDDRPRRTVASAGLPLVDRENMTTDGMRAFLTGIGLPRDEHDAVMLAAQEAGQVVAPWFTLVADDDEQCWAVRWHR